MRNLRNKIFQLFLATLAVVVFACPAGAVNFEIDSPKVILYNMNDDTVLYEQEADEKTEIASLTKIMTAIVVLENSQLSDKVVITPAMLSGLEEFAVVGLSAGQEMTVEELLYALMLPSAGDAGQALAIHIGGTIEKFADMMNQKANSLGLSNTYFTNPVGFDEGNYSTARDVATMLKYALKNPDFLKFFSTNEYHMSVLDKDIEKTVWTTAKSNNLDISFITGAKTGYTNAAGLCLASTATINGVNYLLVNLNAQVGTINNVLDALTVYQYYGDNYSYRMVKQSGEVLWELPVKESRQETLQIKAKNDINLYLENSLDLSTLTYEFTGLEAVTRDLKLGDLLGTYQIKNGDQIIYSEEIFLEEEIHFYNWALYIFLVILGIAIIVIVEIYVWKKLHKKAI